MSRYESWHGLPVLEQSPPQKGRSASRRSQYFISGLGASLKHTASDDENRTSERVGTASQAAESQQLSGRGRLARLERQVENLGIKLARRKECKLHSACNTGGDVAVGIVAQFLPRVGLNKGAAEEEVGHIVAVLGEASEDETIGQSRVLDRQGVGQDGAEAVADVDKLFKGLLCEFGDLAAAKLLRQRAKGVQLERGLDFRDGVSVRGLAEAETVVGDGGETEVVDGCLDVAVVVAVEREVPVPVVCGQS